MYINIDVHDAKYDNFYFKQIICSQREKTGSSKELFIHVNPVGEFYFYQVVINNGKGLLFSSLFKLFREAVKHYNEILK